MECRPQRFFFWVAENKYYLNSLLHRIECCRILRTFILSITQSPTESSLCIFSKSIMRGQTAITCTIFRIYLLYLLVRISSCFHLISRATMKWYKMVKLCILRWSILSSEFRSTRTWIMFHWNSTDVAKVVRHWWSLYKVRFVTQSSKWYPWMAMESFVWVTASTPPDWLKYPCLVKGRMSVQIWVEIFGVARSPGMCTASFTISWAWRHLFSWLYQSFTTRSSAKRCASVRAEET